MFLCFKYRVNFYKSVYNFASANIATRFSRVFRVIDIIIRDIKNRVYLVIQLRDIYLSVFLLLDDFVNKISKVKTNIYFTSVNRKNTVKKAFYNTLE